MVYMGGLNKKSPFVLHVNLSFCVDQTLKSHAFLWISNRRDFYKDM